MTLTLSSCTPGNSASHLSVWLYYVLAMFYDVVTIAISSYYLIQISRRCVLLYLLHDCMPVLTSYCAIRGRIILHPFDLSPDVYGVPAIVWEVLGYLRAQGGDVHRYGGLHRRKLGGRIWSQHHGGYCVPG